MIQRFSPLIRAGARLLLGFSLAWLACVPARAAGPRAIDWRLDLRRAREEAQARNCPLWIQFTGPWCQFCHQMDRESFSDPRVVGRARQSFVAVKLQADAHEELSSRLGIEGLPATVILSPSGTVVAKHEGYVNASTFLRFLEGATVRFGPSRRPEPPAAAADATPRPETDVALAGYCPVSLVHDQRLVPGQQAVTLEHSGRLYRFANPMVRSTFQRQPERFIPVNSGRCPVSQVDQGEARAGDPRFGVLFGGHLYLCADDAGRRQFLKHPERYVHVSMAERGFCPHCWGADRLLAHGLTAPGTTRTGLRYRFSNLGTREALRPDLETSRR